MSGEVIISLLSSMICEEFGEYEVGDALRDGYWKMETYFNMLSKDLDELFIPPFASLNFSLADAMYAWCSGYSLARIAEKYDVSEGAFMRLVLRLDECCCELVNVSVMIGDKNLERKIGEASASMKRAIEFLPSLYL